MKINGADQQNCGQVPADYWKARAKVKGKNSGWIDASVLAVS